MLGDRIGGVDECLSHRLFPKHATFELGPAVKRACESSPSESVSFKNTVRPAHTSATHSNERLEMCVKVSWVAAEVICNVKFGVPPTHGMRIVSHCAGVWGSWNMKMNDSESTDAETDGKTKRATSSSKAAARTSN